MAFKDFAKRSGSLMLAAMFLLTTIGFSALIFLQTKQQDEQDQTNEAIQQALNEQQNNNQGDVTMLQGTQLADFTPTEEPIAELQIIDLKEGDGEEATAESTVTAHYTGAYVVNGEIFQSSKDTGQPFTSPLSGLIAGWQEGIPGMKVGGIRRLVIPGEQAYGPAPAGYVPGSTDSPLGPLVFDIELVAVEQ